MFRTLDEEARELAKELRELKDVIREVSAKLTHIESRVKRTFPAAFPKKTSSEVRPKARKLTDPPTISPQDALKLYDDLVAMAKQGDKEEVQRRLEVVYLPDLALLFRELGVPSGKGKPSRKMLLNGVLSRINESMMLSTSSLRQRPEPSGIEDKADATVFERLKTSESIQSSESPHKDDTDKTGP